jgi:uncharacterized protein YjbI with pentapeptide repeats
MKRSFLRIFVLLAFAGTAALVGAAGARPGNTVGANCVKPLDLQSPSQDLSNCNLNGVTIGGTGEFALEFSNLSGAGLNGARFVGFFAGVFSNLNGANLNGASIDGFETLLFSNLSGANLHGADINGSIALGDSDLSQANLNGARISGSEVLEFSNLTGANLTGAKISGPSALVGAIYSNTICPDGTNSDNDGGTCVGHGVP